MLAYKIADIVINLHGMNKFGFVNLMKNYLVQNDLPSDINIYFSESNKIDEPKGTLIPSSGYWTWIYDGDQEVGAILKLQSGKVVARIDVQDEWKTIKLAWLSGNDYANLQREPFIFALLKDLFAYRLMYYKGVSLHSSGITYNGQAVLFSAPSGTGKSTQTMLWKNVYGDKVSIINDDKPSIRIVDDKVYAYGSPWAGKTGINENKRAELKAILYIKRDTVPHIERMRETEAAMYVSSELNMPVSKKLLAMKMDILTELVRRVPVYALYCNMEKESAITAKEELFGKEKTL